MTENAEKIDEPLPIGVIIDRLYAIRTERNKISARDKELTEEWKELEGILLIALDSQGQDMARSELATATVTVNSLPNVDWDVFGPYIIANDALHLMQRRPSTASIRELITSRQPLPPGVEMYDQRKISLRKRPKKTT